MSDELHKYPGNLKHHRVDKEERRKLLSDMMLNDAKDGLYDAPAKTYPPVSATSEDLFSQRPDWLLNSHDRDIGEYWIDELQDARAKDAELIQRLVDALWGLYRHTDIHQAMGMIEFAASLGFKPSEE